MRTIDDEVHKITLCICKDGYPKLLLEADSHAYVNFPKAITALEEQKDSMATESERTPMYSGFPCMKTKEKYEIIKRFDLETFWKNQVGERYDSVLLLCSFVRMSFCSSV